MVISNRRWNLLFAVLVAGMPDFSPSMCAANGISDFEGVRCVAAALDVGSDPVRCADTELPDCQTPGWFPTGPLGDSIGGVDQMTSYVVGGSIRYNQVTYNAGSYTSWEHGWYSESDVPYGPAVPSFGHLWNKYEGSTKPVKTVICDASGTISYPVD